jgi:hypothetical protein
MLLFYALHHVGDINKKILIKKFKEVAIEPFSIADIAIQASGGQQTALAALTQSLIGVAHKEGLPKQLPFVLMLDFNLGCSGENNECLNALNAQLDILSQNDATLKTIFPVYCILTGTGNYSLEERAIAFKHLQDVSFKHLKIFTVHKDSLSELFKIIKKNHTEEDDDIASVTEVSIAEDDEAEAGISRVNSCMSLTH